MVFDTAVQSVTLSFISQVNETAIRERVKNAFVGVSGEAFVDVVNAISHSIP